MTKSHHGSTPPRAALAAAMLFALACNSGQPDQRGVPDGGGDASGGAIGGGGQGSGTGGAAGGSPGGEGAAAHGNGGSHAGGGGQGGTNVAGAGGRAMGGTGGMPMSGSPCHANDDCGTTGALACRAPGEFLGCGTCRQGQSACGNDTDCASPPDGGVAAVHMICEFAPSTDCYCSSVKTCQPGCRTASDCTTGQGCNAFRHCQNTCTPGPAACPANYACSGGFCTQNTCTDDSQCSGACVKGHCYEGAGVCQFRPA